MNNEQLFLAPGPTMIPDFVWNAINQNVIHHRSTAFQKLYAEIQQGFQYLLSSKNPCLILNGSGTNGMQATISSIFRPKDKVLVLNSGKYGERWKFIAEDYGLNAIEIKTDWGKKINNNFITKKLKEHPDIKAILLTQCETSTGLAQDIEEISFLTKQFNPKILTIVDGIASIGAVPFFQDAWQIDIVVFSSQKALMNPAGLAFVSLSELAQNHLSKKQTSAINLANYLESSQQNFMPFTPATNILFGIRAVLNEFMAQGTSHLWNEIHQRAKYFRTELKSLEGEVFTELPSDAISAFNFPNTDSHNKLKSHLEKNHGIIVAGGQQQLSDKVIRIAHFGIIKHDKITKLLNSLKIIRKEGNNF